MMTWLISLIFSANAQVPSSILSTQQRDLIGNVNLLVNGGAENGRNTWTASGGSFAVNTTVAHVMSGKGSFSWTPSAGAQTVLSDVIVNGSPTLTGLPGVATCFVKTTGTDYQMQVVDGSNSLLSTSSTNEYVPSGSAFTEYSIDFTFPSNGAKLKFLSNSAAAIIYFDNCSIRLKKTEDLTASFSGMDVKQVMKRKNYALNESFPKNVSFWNIANVASFTNGVPSGSLTIGTASQLTLSKSTATTLDANGSLSLVKAAANAQGQMIISDVFTIDDRHRATPFEVAFDYAVTSGASNFDASGTSTQTMEVWLYDVTNSAWIQPAGYRGINCKTAPCPRLTATFQTGSTSGQQYRLSILFRQTDTNGYTVLFDNFYIGTQVTALGVPSTDWVSYSLTIGATTTPPTKGTTVRDQAIWRRIGDSLEFQYNFEQSAAGTSGSGTYLFPLPSGLSIDTSKLSVDTTGKIIVGVGRASEPGGTDEIIEIIAYNSTNFAAKRYNATTLVGSGLFNLGGSGTTVYTMFAKVPIVGWSANVQMSNDTDTRVVSAGMSSSTTALTGTPAKIVYTVKDFDSHGALSGSFDTFSCPVGGTYTVNAFALGPSVAHTVGGSLQLYLYKNGSNYRNIAATNSASTSTYRLATMGSIDFPCNAGDTLNIYGQADDTGSLPSGSTNAWATFRRQSGPAVVAASNSVSARYYGSSTSISGSDTTITYSIKDWDQTESYSSGTYICPISGKYQINAALQMLATYALNNAAAIAIYKNGSIVSQSAQVAGGNTTSMYASISDIVSCNAGDAITIRANSTGTSPSINSSNSRNFFSISRAGN